MWSSQEGARFFIKLLGKYLAEVRPLEAANICVLHICHNYVIENASSSAFVILDFKSNMLIDTAIKVLIKYTKVLFVVLTHCPETRRLSADLSVFFLLFYFFLLFELLSPWILLKRFREIRVVDVWFWNDLVTPLSLFRLLFSLATPSATISRHRPPLSSPVSNHLSLASICLIMDSLLFVFQLLKFLLESIIISVLLIQIYLCLLFFYL